MTEKLEPVLFGDEKKEHGIFSNYWGKHLDKKFKLVIDGKEWQTTEAYYQAQKFAWSEECGCKSEDIEWYTEIIRSANTPNKSKLLGNMKLKGAYAGKWTVSKTDKRLLKDVIAEAKKRGLKLRDDWETAKVDVMIDAQIQKAEQYPRFKRELLETGSRPIHEHTKDPIWADNMDGSGQDLLGRILVCLRDAIRSNWE